MRRSRDRRWARPAADSAGFTLIELVVAMVLGAVVVTIVFQLINAQGRFVELQSAREEVQQNNRAAIELIGSELRALPPGEGLVRASADSITLRSTRIWGVVCAVGPNSIDVVFPTIAGASYPVNSGTGAVVNVGTREVPMWSSPVAVTAVGAAAPTCAGAPVPVGAERRTVSVAVMPANGAGTPVAGDAMYLFDLVTYRTGTSSGVPGRWIQRRVGDAGSSSNQPMAGPIDDAAGLRFRYFVGASTTSVAGAVLDAPTRNGVTRVMLIVDAVSRRSFATGRVQHVDTLLVSLRNRS